ncbi:NaeI family type II restriction endonuclease [Kribbella sp. NBC_00889]|uniref:NaeI family type II restriction endonuclease n=1 Tax=Kribbella sp. NBC_00889 TaxID=2975974 RepID=UPI00386B451E|nr:NaeI family type II restriction endonuclease [Kribbella sp. NBC_00889]
MVNAGTLCYVSADRYNHGDALFPDETLIALPRPLRAHRGRIIPNPPPRSGRPRADYGPAVVRTSYGPPSPAEDPELWGAAGVLKQLDPHGIRAGYAIREAFDQIYDGQRTGRWDYRQLMKTEKTHLGTLVEIAFQREFEFADGDDLDYSIAGVDVDCKWSRNLYEWEFPPEMYNRGDKIALVVWANDFTARWAMGLIRVTEQVLVPLGKQRDKKRRLNNAGRDRILWLVPGADLVRNTLLHIDQAKLERIVYATYGQTAITNLFRELTGVLVNRATVLTAAQQVDSAKRVRDARARLRPEGIVIFGHYIPHPEMAEQLGLPRPTLGRFVSTRLATWNPGDNEPFIELAGSKWRRARESDPAVTAPRLPEQGQDPN